MLTFVMHDWIYMFIKYASIYYSVCDVYNKLSLLDQQLNESYSTSSWIHAYYESIS